MKFEGMLGRLGEVIIILVAIVIVFALFITGLFGFVIAIPLFILLAAIYGAIKYIWSGEV